jgi:hypothetical protein
MAELTRRGFIVNTSALGAAAAGSVAATQLMTGSSPTVARPKNFVPDTLVVHIRDLATSEIALMAGTAEVVYRDAELVDRLLAAAKRNIGG